MLVQTVGWDNVVEIICEMLCQAVEEGFHPNIGKSVYWLESHPQDESYKTSLNFEASQTFCMDGSSTSNKLKQTSVLFREMAKSYFKNH